MRDCRASASCRHFLFLGAAVLIFMTSALSCSGAGSRQDFNRALEKASAKNTFVVLDVSASW